MKRLSALAVVLLLTACEPKAPELDGAPTSGGGPAPVDGGELAGGAPVAGTLLPGIINLVPPTGMQVVDACERVVAPDYDKPPAMTCLLFTADDRTSPEVDPQMLNAMKAAGWDFVRATGDQRYFERVKLNTDCADLAALSVVTDHLKALVNHATPGGEPSVVLPTHTVWRAYAITHSIREACGPDRMRP